MNTLITLIYYTPPKEDYNISVIFTELFMLLLKLINQPDLLQLIIYLIKI